MEILLGIAMFCATIAVVTIRQKDLVTASYYQGYRAAIKEAVINIKDAERKAMEDAPVGEMCAGVIRAQAIHETELIVRDLTYRIGRPI